MHLPVCPVMQRIQFADGFFALHMMSVSQCNCSFISADCLICSSGSLGLVGMTKLVFQEEGLSGFYGGVVGVMIGQGY